MTMINLRIANDVDGGDDDEEEEKEEKEEKEREEKEKDGNDADGDENIRFLILSCDSKVYALIHN